jgi:hypothetical protein
VNNHTNADFWGMYSKLPKELKAASKEKFKLFLKDPRHPSLRFKPLKKDPDLWSVRVNISIRAVCYRKGEDLYWYWIGTHAEFDRDFV